eukprot:g25196.t1
MAVGEPGKKAQVTQTIRISMKETPDGKMVFTPNGFKVRKGQTIRFTVKNDGELDHEFVLDREDKVMEHKAVMEKFPEMEHDDPNAIRLAPGKSGEIVWKFTNDGVFKVACLIPGHYDAGMHGDEFTSGTVKKVDAKAKKVTLIHEELKSLEMPAMTMVFTVEDAALLAKLKEGAKVQFVAERKNGKLTVTQACPVWIGHPMTAHWGVEDPAAVTGTEVEIQGAFAQAARFLKNRIMAFLSLPLESIDRMALQTKLRQIGAMEGVARRLPDNRHRKDMNVDVTIYHNPDCGTSRNTLALIRAAGIEPTVVEYLQNPPTRDQLAKMIADAGMTVRDAIREKGTPYAELGLVDPDLTDEQLLDAMIATPILINRPLVVTPLGTRLARPSEIVLDILPTHAFKGPFVKEDGEQVLDEKGQRIA